MVFLRKACLSGFHRTSIWNDHISGLAQATVDQPIVSTLVPRLYFDKAFYYNVVAAVVNTMSTLLRNTGPKNEPFGCATVLGH